MDNRSKSGKRLRAKGSPPEKIRRQPDQPRSAVVGRGTVEVARTRAQRATGRRIVSDFARCMFWKHQRRSDVRFARSNGRPMARDPGENNCTPTGTYFHVL